jgi:hypothetical protein
MSNRPSGQITTQAPPPSVDQPLGRVTTLEKRLEQVENKLAEIGNLREAHDSRICNLENEFSG